jgi:hypothetical protein
MTVPEVLRTTLQGIEVEVVVLHEAVLGGTERWHLSLSPVQVRNRAEHAALAELERTGARVNAGEWWLEIGSWRASSPAAGSRTTRSVGASRRGRRRGLFT